MSFAVMEPTSANLLVSLRDTGVLVDVISATYRDRD